MMPLPRTPPANQNKTSKRPHEATWSSSPGVNPPQPDQQQAIKCPRCNSSSTKFCYYNNYSVAQPRHFCKTCRRYWTKGGSLRNVPVGGGSRKTKRLKSSSSSSKDLPANIGGLKLPHVMSPALNFQLGGIEIPRVNAPNVLTGGIYDSQLPALEGLNFPLLMVIPPKQKLGPSSSACPPRLGEPISTKVDGSLVSCTESLSRVDQDLHWKLQQQRLATISGSAPQQENIGHGTNSAPPAMEWFSGNWASQTSVTPSPSVSPGDENTNCNNNNNNNNNNGGAALIQHDQSWGARNVQQYASVLL